MDTIIRAIISYSLFLAVLLVSLLQLSAAASFSVCPPGQYRDSVRRTCQDCSKCPMNEIVRRPCSQNKDTTCGPFYEFEFFNQDGGADDADDDDAGDERYRGGDFNLFKVVSTDKPLVEEDGEKKRDGVEESVHVQETFSVNVPYEQTAANRWRELCYGLIAGITLITFLFIVYVAYTQVQLRALTAKVKVANTHEGKEEPIYCYTQMFTEESPDGAKSKQTPPVRVAHGIYKPTGARKINNVSARAFPNEYAAQIPATETIPEEDNLLPVIPEGSSTDSDHVRVVYTNQK